MKRGDDLVSNMLPRIEKCSISGNMHVAWLHASNKLPHV